MADSRHKGCFAIFDLTFSNSFSGFGVKTLWTLDTLEPGLNLKELQLFKLFP